MGFRPYAAGICLWPAAIRQITMFYISAHKRIEGAFMRSRLNCLIPLIGLLLAGCGDDSGKKQSECPAGGSMCPDGQCYNLSFDNLHCGSCDNVCDSTESCQNGICTPIPIEARCPAPKKVCGDLCVDIRSDREHCGECNHLCEPDELCKNRTCVKSCEAPETACSDGCHDLNNDTKNCKTCGHDCNAGLAEGAAPFVCVNGECVNDCPESELICGGNCTNPKTNKNYCGAADDCKGSNAGKACVTGAECSDGTCTCTNSDEIECKIGGQLQCANPKSLENCGCDAENAGLNCNTLPHTQSGECSSDGQCTLVCSDHFGNCNNDAADGCEADLTSIDNCGTCGNACDADNASGATCENGECKYTCGENAVMCGNSCVDLSKDNDNCGWCGNQCSGKSTCQGGFCVIDESECQDGYVENIPVVNYDGTEKTVKAYCIKDLEELTRLREHIHNTENFHDGSFTPYPSAEKNPDNAYILMGNINMGSNNAWKPIGIGPTFKNAYFLGNGKRIYGTLVNSGLFAIVENAVIQDLNLELNIKNNPQSEFYRYPGSLVEIMDGNAALRRIREKGTIECYNSQCGGIVGLVDGDCTDTLSQIDMQGTIDASNAGNVGGIAGVARTKQMDQITSNVSIIDSKNSNYVRSLFIGYYNDSQGCAERNEPAIISDCQAKGSIQYKEGVTFSDETTHSAVAGGLIGQLSLRNSNLDIRNCNAEIQLDMQAHNSGGLIAQINSYDDVKLSISDCETRGSIDCWSNCGGFIGTMTAGLSNPDDEKDPEPIVVTNSHAKVDIKSESEFDQMDYFGGFVGNVSRGMIKNCSAEGKVETKTSDKVGGFAGKAEFTTLSDVSFEGSVVGRKFVGGLAGSVSYNSIVENATAKGQVKGSEEAIGGFIGNAVSTKSIENGVAQVDVEAMKIAGSFIGQYRGGSLSNCAATGNVTCLGNGVTNGSSCGFIGELSGSTTIKKIASYGDTKGDTSIGGLIGYLSEGPHIIEDVLVTGNLTSNLKDPGAIVGSAYRTTVQTLNNIYYWKSSEDLKIIGAGADGIDVTGVKSFTYNEEKKPILEDGTSLIEELKDTGKWLESACNLKTGPGVAHPGVYYIPVLKSLGMDICESAD